MKQLSSRKQLARHSTKVICQAEFTLIRARALLAAKARGGERKTMPQLDLIIRYQASRYHGQEWPLSPARIFQAMIAAAAEIGALDLYAPALRWLEQLAPPVMVASAATHADSNGIRHLLSNDNQFEHKKSDG